MHNFQPCFLRHSIQTSFLYTVMQEKEDILFHEENSFMTRNISLFILTSGINTMNNLIWLKVQCLAIEHPWVLSIANPFIQKILRIKSNWLIFKSPTFLSSTTSMFLFTFFSCSGRGIFQSSSNNSIV